MRKLTAITLATLMALGTSTAFAADTATPTNSSTQPQVQPTKPADGQHKHRMTKHGKKDHRNMFGGVELTKEQQEKVRQLMEANKPPRGPGHMADVHTLIASDKLDETKLNQITQDMAKAHANHIKVQHEIYNMLTPEQKQQYNKNYQERTEKMKERLGKRPNGDVPPPAAE